MLLAPFLLRLEGFLDLFSQKNLQERLIWYIPFVGKKFEVFQ
jgi:hypothetical protein